MGRTTSRSDRDRGIGRGHPFAGELRRTKVTTRSRKRPGDRVRGFAGRTGLEVRESRPRHEGSARDYANDQSGGTTASPG